MYEVRFNFIFMNYFELLKKKCVVIYTQKNHVNVFSIKKNWTEFFWVFVKIICLEIFICNFFHFNHDLSLFIGKIGGRCRDYYGAFVIYISIFIFIIYERVYELVFSFSHFILSLSDLLITFWLIAIRNE